MGQYYHFSQFLSWFQWCEFEILYVAWIIKVKKIKNLRLCAAVTPGSCFRSKKSVCSLRWSDSIESGMKPTKRINKASRIYGQIVDIILIKHWWYLLCCLSDIDIDQLCKEVVSNIEVRNSDKIEDFSIIEHIIQNDLILPMDLSLSNVLSGKSFDEELEDPIESLNLCLAEKKTDSRIRMQDK